MKKCLCILTMSLFVFVGFSTEAFSGVPPWMEPFVNPNPTYKFDWAFSRGVTAQANSGQWYDTGLYAHVGQSRGDGTSYTASTPSKLIL